MKPKFSKSQQQKISKTNQRNVQSKRTASRLHGTEISQISPSAQKRQKKGKGTLL